MKQKTAMQQLMDLMSEQPFTFGNAINLVILNELIEKEKEQILDAHLNGQQDHHFSLESRMAESEDYYNETYNQNK
jgi:hypothetical protein